MSGDSSTTQPSDAEAICAAVRAHWGFSELRPLQLEAMLAARRGRDALVVMPTGGGKSLCYQAPALLADKLTVVVSPLIALMKDQVDALIGRGIPAAFLNSSLDLADKRRVAGAIASGDYRLLFVAPERFASGAFWQLLEAGGGGIGAFAIDEAHCISHWGHDFRNDYRQLHQLKDRFPEAAIHAFTATATPRVRDDIVEQLRLREPDILVGDFFRPNLNYRVERRTGMFDDVRHEIERRRGQAGIVYCIRRADVDELTAHLCGQGIRAVGYHAGMSDDRRTRAQDAFAAGEFDVVVATVAFGMGIDRADIRFVIHAAMPKSIEHYQQETGRAGRDGEQADCILFYTGGDFAKWKSIIENNEPTHSELFVGMLSHMYRYCTGITCRHKALVTYFGQKWERDECGACDVCEGGLEPLPDSTELAQKIMSAVVRTGERYGAAYVCEVLMGCETERVTARGHDQQSTFALMCDHDNRELMTWIDQLVDQEALERDGKYRVLKVTRKGWQILRSEAEARLLHVEKPKRPKRRKRATRSITRRRKTANADETIPKRTDVVLGENLNCPSCNYSLIGSTTGVCPECGQPIPFEKLGLSKWRFLRRASELAGGTSPDQPTTEHVPNATAGAPSLAKRRVGDGPGTQSAAVESNARILPDGPLDADEKQLFEQLRALRREIADEINSPAFVVFSDKTLRAIARAKPTDEISMLAVKGIGPAKYEAFGERFLGVIREF